MMSASKVDRSVDVKAPEDRGVRTPAGNDTWKPAQGVRAVGCLAWIGVQEATTQAMPHCRSLEVLGLPRRARTPLQGKNGTRYYAN